MDILQGIKHQQPLARPRLKHFKFRLQGIKIYLGLLLLWHLSGNLLSAQSNTNLTYPKFKTDHVLTECFINQSLLYLGTVEKPKGSNWGKEVQEMLKSVGINFPAPWCAAYVGIVCRNSCISYPYSGFVPNWSVGTWKEKVVFDKRKASRSVLPTEVRRGDIATIYFSSLKRDAHLRKSIKCSFIERFSSISASIHVGLISSSKPRSTSSCQYDSITAL